ncbi:MAG: triple tyrosine motif-containing protein [Pirellulales bacterium]
MTRTDDGKIWFTTIRGLIVIDTRNVAHKLPPIPVVVEETLIDGRSLGAAKTLRLPPGTSNVGFRFTGLSFQSPARITFRYRLDGFDDDWIDAGTRREATYANLPPGEYAFRVSATNVDGQAHESDRPIALTIEPRLTQRTGFGPSAQRWRARSGGPGIACTSTPCVVGARRSSTSGGGSRELHDTLLQGFAGVTMEMQALGADAGDGRTRRTARHHRRRRDLSAQSAPLGGRLTDGRRRRRRPGRETGRRRDADRRSTRRPFADPVLAHADRLADRRRIPNPPHRESALERDEACAADDDRPDAGIAAENHRADDRRRRRGLRSAREIRRDRRRTRRPNASA